MAVRFWRALAVTGSGLPSKASARASSCSIAASSSRRRTKTWLRDSKAPLSSNDGFSVVAPTRVTTPASTNGRKPSCWARLKRWISSTNSKVAWPALRRILACSKAFFRSATPLNTADSAMNS